MYNDPKKKGVGINKYSMEIKEKSILTNFPKPKPNLENKPFLYFDPEEVILQSIILK